MMMKQRILRLAAAACLLMASQAQAVLTIDITQGVDKGIPIAIVPFEVTPAQTLPESIWDVVQADLGRSGRFEPVPQGDFLSQPHTVTQIQYKDWRLLKANALVIGQVQQMGADNYQVEFRLMDVFSERQLAGNRYVVSGKLLRKVAHKISDMIYETLTGIPGAFDTKIAYVTKTGEGAAQRFSLKVADSDGYRPFELLSSKQPIMSPAWSPQSDRLAYVSFEKRRSMIYVQNLRTGTREVISEYSRINSSPAWSPDGNRLALTLSKDGNAEIYVKDMNSGSLQRLTNHSSIDTEPSWSPDGRSIVFSSGRSGKPQVYQVSANGGGAKRLTFQGSYNAAPSYSPDGKHIVMITDVGGGNKVGIYSVASRTTRALTDTRLDESPSFAPNGDMILYSTLVGSRKVLSAVSADGRVKQVLRFDQGEVREPAWSLRLP